MKSTTIPPLRVSTDLRKEAESVLEDGETLSAFVLDAITRTIEQRKAQQAFIRRGIANAAKSRETGEYVSSARVIEKLERRLATARKRARR